MLQDSQTNNMEPLESAFAPEICKNKRVICVSNHRQVCRKFFIRRTKRFVPDHVKARLQRRFLSGQLDAIYVALKLQQVSNMFEIPAISRRQIALKIAPGLQVRF